MGRWPLVLAAETAGWTCRMTGGSVGMRVCTFRPPQGNLAGEFPDMPLQHMVRRKPPAGGSRLARGANPHFSFSVACGCASARARRSGTGRPLRNCSMASTLSKYRCIQWRIQVCQIPPSGNYSGAQSDRDGDNIPLTALRHFLAGHFPNFPPPAAVSQLSSHPGGTTVLFRVVTDFPPSHNLVLFGQPHLMQTLALTVNEEIRSRITYSVLLPRLSPEDIETFLLDQFDRAGLGRNIYTEDAIALIVRTAEGILRRARNLALGALIEAVRDQTRTVDIQQINSVLMQPHWRKTHDLAAL